MNSFVDDIGSFLMKVALDWVRHKIEESWCLKSWEWKYKQNGSENLSFDAIFKNLTVSGVQAYDIKKLQFNSALSQVDFDISIPQVELSVDQALLKSKHRSRCSEVFVGGRVTLVEASLTGTVALSLSSDLSVSLSDLDLNLKLKSIQSEMKTIFNATDYSEQINSFLSKTLTDSFKNYQTTISYVLSEIIMIFATYLASSNDKENEEHITVSVLDC